MKSAFAILLVFLAITACADEPDILAINAKYPVRAFVEGNKPAPYGNPQLAQAVKALADIPRPWTVPKIRAEFERESGLWLQKLARRILEKKDTMWAEADKEQERCGHLATLLAASRDPRAALTLGKGFETPDFPEAIKVLEGLHLYFLSDPQYRQPPPDPKAPIATTNFYPHMRKEVQSWWALNKVDLQKMVQVKETPPPPPN